MRVLVVDDHPLIREALRQVLKALDPDIILVEAAGMPEALAAADENERLDLILLDLTLPGADGMEALHALRERHPSFPVVVLSATERPETVMQALDAGAMGFIPKTSSNEVLLSALRLVLSGGVYLPAEVLRHSPAPAIGSKPGPAAGEVDYRDLGLTERQAEVLALAQSMGEISLSLRSLADSDPSKNEPTAQIGEANQGSVKILKYGVPSRTFGVN